jgi:Animal haem peroxidase
MRFTRICLAAVLVILCSRTLSAEDRAIDGTGNNIANPNLGASNTTFDRFNYKAQFFGADAAMPSETQRPNARDISNAVSAQSASRPSARHLSNYIWAWGQFLTHDIALSTTSNGPTVNGTAPISIHLPTDPLGPNPIPFTRSNYVGDAIDSQRTPINEVTSFIDASSVYGSDATRAAALRTGGGSGAKLLTSEGSLLPRNAAGLPVENNGPLPNDQLFLAGDIRSNENSLLTSLHTVFMREHNRLVDRIVATQPELDEEQQYQLARKIVGAEMQAITYREFLPALLGDASSIPKAEHYGYTPHLPPTITTAFSHAAFRFGHSAVTSQINLVDAGNSAAGSLPLRNMFYNPELIGQNPQLVEELLRGAATQHSEEIDSLVVDDLRNFLFGPPGAGGLDLAALNVQRGRDAGLPSLNGLGRAFNFEFVSSFGHLTSDQDLAAALAALYGTVSNTDVWVAGLAQNHEPGSSVGDVFQSIIERQFRHLRDGDRLFYRGNAAGLYTGGVLNSDIAAIVDLENITLADILLANTDIEKLQSNVFFVPPAGDFNDDGQFDAADYVVWRKHYGTGNVWLDANRDGIVDEQDLSSWLSAFNAGSQSGDAGTALAPEPSTRILTLIAVALCRRRKRPAE